MGTKRLLWACVIGAAIVIGLMAQWASARFSGGEGAVQTTAAAEAPTLSLFEFQRLHEAGKVLVVDVRSSSSFADGHIAGATNVPLAELTAHVERVRHLRGDRQVVTYCACPVEASSLQAVSELAGHGVPAKALVGGYRAWVAAGGRTERP